MATTNENEAEEMPKGIAVGDNNNMLFHFPIGITDPTVAPGYQAPNPSIIASLIAGEEHYWFKTGPADTDWIDLTQLIKNVVTQALQWSNKLRYLDMVNTARDTNIVSGDPFVTLFTYSGSGVLAHFTINLEQMDKYWAIKLTVDGDEVFGTNGIRTEDIRDNEIYDIEHHGNHVHSNVLNIGVHKDKFTWSSPINIPGPQFETSVSVQLKRLSGTTNKKYRAGLIVMSQET